MTHTDSRENAAISTMALDILTSVLGELPNAKKALALLAQRIREITGAKTVLIATPGEKAEAPPRIVTIAPRRRAEQIRSDLCPSLILAGLSLRDPALWRPDESEISRILAECSCSTGLTLAVPLSSGESTLGVLLAMDLMDEEFAGAAR